VTLCTLAGAGRIGSVPIRARVTAN